MRNVTISLSEDLARWARIWAAEHDTSVSSYIADMLNTARERETRYLSSGERFLVLEARPLSGGDPYPSRDSLYDR